MGSGIKFDAKQHLKFAIDRDFKGKTKRWNVWNRLRMDFLGTIKWYGAWRKYCFFPDDGTIYDSKCMKRIMEFIDEQTDIRNAERRKKKGK